MLDTFTQIATRSLTFSDTKYDLADGSNDEVQLCQLGIMTDIFYNCKSRVCWFKSLKKMYLKKIYDIQSAWKFTLLKVMIKVSFFFLKICLFILHRESMCMQAGGGAEVKSPAGSRLSTEPDTGLDLTTPRSPCKQKSRVGHSTDCANQALQNCDRSFHKWILKCVRGHSFSKFFSQMWEQKKSEARRFPSLEPCWDALVSTPPMRDVSCGVYSKCQTWTPGCKFASATS